MTFGLLRALSTLVDRGRIASSLSQTFGGNRNLYTALGYPDLIDVAKYRWRFDRGDIGARIVEAYPEDTWRGPGVVIEDKDPDVETDFEDAWESLEKRLGVWSVFQRADVLAGIGRYSVIVIGAAGEPDQELPRMSSPDQVLYLMPYSEEDARIEETGLVGDMADPRFGLPMFYTVRVAMATGKLTSRQVHWTRVLHIADGLLDSRLYASPRLKRVWNRLEDLDKVAGGGAEAFWIRANKGTLYNIDKDVRISQEELDQMEEQLDEFEAKLRRNLKVRGVTATDLGSEVADFSAPVASIISIISGATGIPQRILLGSERGELASTQDATAWDNRVKNRRNDFAGPLVVRPFVQRLIDYGALPEPTQFEIVWPDLTERTEDEKLTMADKASKLNSQSGTIVITGDEIREMYLGLDPLEPEQIEEEEIATAPAETPDAAMQEDQGEAA